MQSISIRLLALWLLMLTNFESSFGEEGPICDSKMSMTEALQGVSPKCPQSIIADLVLIDVEYVGMDGNLHTGQVVAHRDLEEDLRHVFGIAKACRFPIQSVIPVSNEKFRHDGTWGDELSMEANNTSCFNFRQITNGGKLSNHALGRAIDINPKLNPYIKGQLVLPKGATYDPLRKGTLTREHPVTVTVHGSGDGF